MIHKIQEYVEDESIPVKERRKGLKVFTWITLVLIGAATVFFILALAGLILKK